MFERDVFELDTEIFADQRAARQRGDIAEHRLAAITKSGSLHSTNIQSAAKLVDDQQRQRFRIDIFGDDQQRLTSLSRLFQQRDEIANVADLLFVQQHKSVLEVRFHRTGIGNEVGRNVPLVELHSVDVLDFHVTALAFFHGDHTVLADTLESVGQQFANLVVVVGRDRTDVGDFLLILDGTPHLDEVIAGCCDRLFDAATNRCGVAARHDVSQAFFENGASQHGRRRGSVTGKVARLLCDLDDELCTHVFESVFQFDFLGDGHAVFGHGRPAKRFVDDHVATGWSHRDRHRIGQLIDTGHHASTSMIVKKELFCHEKIPQEKMCWLLSNA